MSTTNQSFSNDKSLKAAMSDATKSTFEDMVKKVIMDMVSDNDSDSILTIETVSSEKELNPVKAERRRSSSLSQKKTRRGRSKSRHSTIIKKDVSKMSLVEEKCGKIDTKGKMKTKTRTSDGKKKSRNKTRSRLESISPLSSRSPTARKSQMALNFRMGEVFNDLYDIYCLELSKNKQQQQQKHNIDDSDDTTVDSSRTSIDSLSSSMTGGSVFSKPSTSQFYEEMICKLRPHLNSLCINHDSKSKLYKYDDTGCSTEVVSQVNDFEAAFEPEEMRCLALVSHNEMKATMKDFVIKYKYVLKKFRLTGTQSTMKMLGEVFEGDGSVVFGPACNSGPLGGDAEIVAMMATGQLGGILFFQDPMTAHPHQVDIECLVRQALVHSTVMATTPTTAMSIMEVFKMALEGSGRPEIIPSFFFSFQSPTVEAYKNNQKNAIASHVR
jgi:methylglyoxal synthase